MKFSITRKGRLVAEGKWPTTILGAKIVSVQKWLVAKRLRPSWGLASNTCALCQIYVEVNNECNGCPIMEITGRNNCNNTPWYDAKAELSLSSKNVYHTNREIRFLISLLPGLSWLRRGMKQENGSYA